MQKTEADACKISDACSDQLNVSPASLCAASVKRVGAETALINTECIAGCRKTNTSPILTTMVKQVVTLSEFNKCADWLTWAY